MRDANDGTSLFSHMSYDSFLSVIELAMVQSVTYLENLIALECGDSPQGACCESKDDKERLGGWGFWRA